MIFDAVALIPSVFKNFMVCRDNCIIIPSTTNCVCERVYSKSVFTLSVRPNDRKCVRNVLFP